MSVLEAARKNAIDKEDIYNMDGDAIGDVVDCLKRTFSDASDPGAKKVSAALVVLERAISNIQLK